MPTFASGRRTSTPSTRIDPDVGVYSPAISISRVLLPHPLGPTMLQISPGVSSRLTSSIAGAVWPLRTYDFARPAIATDEARRAAAGAAITWPHLRRDHPCGVAAPAG